ncbi:hypothetical protein BJY21_001798 [Kineosphaera limosa]|uniref:Uncharacterized protein n=1 Tax=Kineosphaera limosa NBRC 100340 TaxID=1184609 RepID=K6WZI5_9MICO|nr:hypothetical protein [Kineosphaera limosa]NYE00614.1 hypothetical protein [Kineosphaera limosa]GAB97532.1 hypothetical protein KILIM_073_00120 [Kineosphaera limosa NBRC 100340]
MNGGRPTRRVARGYAPKPRTRSYRSTPKRPHDQPPRGLRPRATGIRRDHSELTRQAGTGCRHTQGLEEVWSARHGDSVEPWAGTLAPAIVLTDALDAAARPMRLSAAHPSGRPGGAHRPSPSDTPVTRLGRFVWRRCRAVLALLWFWSATLLRAEPDAGGLRLPRTGGATRVGAPVPLRSTPGEQGGAKRPDVDRGRQMRLENRAPSGGGAHPAPEPEPHD